MALFCEWNATEIGNGRFRLVCKTCGDEREHTEPALFKNCRGAGVEASISPSSGQTMASLHPDTAETILALLRAEGPATTKAIQERLNCGRVPGVMKALVASSKLWISTPAVVDETLFCIPREVRPADVKKKFDVVYPLGTGSRWQDNELRYSLRSLVKNFPELGRVFVVGHKPAWLQNVNHLPHGDPYRHNKDANLIEKVLAACEADVSPLFLRLSDDEFLLRPILFDFTVPLHNGDLTARPAEYFDSAWKGHLRNTRDWLVQNGFGAMHFDCHAPNAYRKGHFVTATAAAPWRTTPMTINTLYYNAARIPGRVAGRENLSIHTSIHDVKQIHAMLSGRRYFNLNDAALTPAMKSVLAELFPEPSPFEVDAGSKIVPAAVVSLPATAPLSSLDGEPIEWTRMLFYDDLARDARAMIGRVPPEVDLVVGAARSGLLPAATIATALHLPIFSCSLTGIVDPGHGNRLPRNRRIEPRCVLVVEDTASSGNSIQFAGETAQRRWPRARIIKAAVYASSRGAKVCDLVGRLYERPHFLEWNFPNAWIYANMAYDFDGIFCEDCPREADDDGPRYEEFLGTARPRYLPRKYPIKQIVTARLERWRPQTEEWLRRHRVNVLNIAMGPWASLAARKAAGDVAEFKAYCLKNSSCYAFCESDPRQAEKICQLARKPVLCPAAKRFFVPKGYSWGRMSRQLRA